MVNHNWIVTKEVRRSSVFSYFFFPCLTFFSWVLRVNCSAWRIEYPVWLVLQSGVCLAETYRQTQLSQGAPLHQSPVVVLTVNDKRIVVKQGWTTTGKNRNNGSTGSHVNDVIGIMFFIGGCLVLHCSHNPTLGPDDRSVWLKSTGN